MEYGVTFEPPLKGNPHQFVIKQHFHTAHAISKFYGSDGKVDVHNLITGKTKRKHKRDKIFCAKRNWDQKAEIGIMSKIENEFHEEINNLKPFNSRNHSAISEYFLLWRIRHHFHMSRMEDKALIGVTGSGLTKEQEEIFESKGGMFIRDGGVVPARFMTGVQVIMQLDRQRPGVKDLKWGLLASTDGEFVVADCYNDLTFMPISPSLAFCAGYADMEINRQSVANTNKQSIEASSEFYFAKDLTLCPVA